MTYVDAAGYVWERGKVVGRTSPELAGKEVGEGEYIPASGYEEARKIAPPPADRPGGTKVKVAIGTTESGEPIEREVYLEEVVGTYRREGKEGVRKRYGEKVAEKVQIEEREGEYTVNYPVFEREEREEQPPHQFVRKPREPSYDIAGGFGAGEEEYIPPEKVKEIQRRQYKESLIQGSMYAYVDEQGRYVYPGIGTVREQTTTEKLQSATVGRYYEAVGNRYYAEKSIEVAKWGSLAAFPYGVGFGLGALAATGARGAMASRAIGTTLSAGLTLAGIREAKRAAEHGDYKTVGLILGSFAVAGVVGPRGYMKGYRWREERGIKSISDAVRVTQRRYKVVESVGVERTPEGGIKAELLSAESGRFARLETSKANVLREKGDVWMYREEPIIKITRMSVKESKPQVKKLAVGQREAAEPYGFGAGAVRQVRLKQQVKSKVVEETARSGLKAGRNKLLIELPRERGIPGIRFSPFIPVTMRSRDRLQRRGGIINTIEAIAHSPRERIQQIAGLGLRTRQAETTIPQIRQGTSQRRIERLGILEEQRTATKLNRLLLTIGGQLKPRRGKGRRGRPFRFGLPALGGKAKESDVIPLNIGKRYAEELIYPFFGVKVGGKKRRRRR